VLDVSQAQLAITRTISLQAVDANEQAIDGLTITPDQITVTQYITQRGGYRNVVVKVTSAGQVENGYRLTNLSVYPPTVTIFSSDPQQVNEIPGYIETVPVDLNGVKDDQDLKVALNLPSGVSVVGDQTVQVQVGIAAIEGSITLNNMRIELVGLAEGIFGRVSPETVDVIISGPLPLLDGLKSRDVSVVVEMNGEDVGNYQRTPRVLLKSAELSVESILPGSVEVNVIGRVTITPTVPPRITPTPTSTPTPLPQ
jgi:YbbR domain-containing protein